MITNGPLTLSNSFSEGLGKEMPCTSVQPTNSTLVLLSNKEDESQNMIDYSGL